MEPESTNIEIKEDIELINNSPINNSEKSSENISSHICEYDNWYSE
jgi:hypothetical protein